MAPYLRSALGSVLAVLCLTGPPAASSAEPGIVIGDAWSRALPPVVPNGAVYMRIENRSGRDDTLLGAASPIAERAAVHEHVREGDMMRMRPAGPLALPAGEVIVLAPGGLHVMLFGLREPLRAGRTYPLTLELEHAGSVEVRVTVGPPAAGSGPAPRDPPGGLGRHRH